MTTQRTSYIVRFLADLSGYNPAGKIAAQNQQIAASGRQLAQSQATAAAAAASSQAAQVAAAAGGAETVRRRRNLRDDTGAAATAAIVAAAGIGAEGTRRRRQLGGEGAGAAIAAAIAARHAARGGLGDLAPEQAAAAATAASGQSWFQTLAGYGSDLRGNRLAQGAGRRARGGAGALFGVVAGAAGGPLGLLGAGIGLTSLARASISAARSLRTVEALKFDATMFRLRHEARLLLAELGTFVLPALTWFAQLLTRVIKGLQGFSGVVERIQTFGSRVTQGVGEAFQGPRVNPSVDFSGLLGKEKSTGSTLFGLIRYQHGGVVQPRPGGSIVRVAEAGEAEAIIPMRQLTNILSPQMRMPQGMDSASRLKELADEFQSALEYSQDLPPLWQDDDGFGDRGPLVVRPDGGSTSINNLPAARPLRYITKAAYDALPAPKTGLYAVYSTS